MNKQLDIFDNIQEAIGFNFEENKARLVENLEYLKTLTVEEQTLYKKWLELNKDR